MRPGRLKTEGGSGNSRPTHFIIPFIGEIRGSIAFRRARRASARNRLIHVHARYGDGEAVFDVEPVVELHESYGLRVAQELAEEHRELITEKWHELLG